MRALCGDVRVTVHPELEIKLVHGLSRQITDDIIGFKVDFGIVVNPVAHPDLVIKVLAKDEVGLYIADDGEALSAAEAGDGILIADPDLAQTQALQKQLGRRGLAFKRTVTTSSLEVVVSLVAQGLGVGILPGRVATKDPHITLKPCPQTPKFQDRICLAYRADAQRTPASRLLIQSMSTCLS